MSGLDLKGLTAFLALLKHTTQNTGSDSLFLYVPPAEPQDDSGVPHLLRYTSSV
jgi:hypothetical protein